MARPEHDLGDAELEVLKILWGRGSATVRQVLEALREGGKKVAYTTVLTFLTRLEQKGYVTSNKSGLAYVYKARVSKRRVARTRLRALMQQLFDGTPGAMVLQLMEGERFTPEEIGELRRLIDDSDPERRDAGEQG